MSWDIFNEVGQILTEMGGSGSGHKGHKGVKGQKRGSAPRSRVTILPPTDTSKITMEETFNTIITRKSYGEQPISVTGSVYRGSSNQAQPTGAILEKSEVLTGIEGRIGVFATNNEDEAAFFAVVNAVTHGALPEDIWDGSSRWDMYGQKPAVYKLANSDRVKHWEEWKPPPGVSVSMPFSTKYNELVIKDLTDLHFVKVRDVTQKELERSWDYMVSNGWAITLKEVATSARKKNE